MTETNRIEYKRELTSELDIEKEVVAFLNYKEGGYIYIGIDKDGSTVGVSDVDDCMLRLKDRIKHNISLLLWDYLTLPRSRGMGEALSRLRWRVVLKNHISKRSME